MSFKNYANQVIASMQHNASSIAQKIVANTIIINGEEDIICTPKEASVLVEKIKSSELVFLKNVGHMIPVENAAYLAKIIKEFCS